MYTNPPDPNTILVDHGLEEDIIWNFPKNLYNMPVIKNDYNGGKDLGKNFAPFWGRKLSMMAWHNPDKFPKFYRHWEHRKGLQIIMMEHALKYRHAHPSNKEIEEMSDQIN